MYQHKIFILLKNYLQSSHIINYGINLTKEMQAKAVLLAIEKITTPLKPILLQDSNLSHHQAFDTKSFKKKIIEHFEKHQLSVEDIWKDIYCNVVVGFSDDKIIRLTEEQDPFLLLVEGQNEYSTFHEWFGNYETKIAEKADCPVLVVQPTSNWQPIKKILYIMDLDDAKLDNMSILTTLTEKLDAHLQVIFLSEKSIHETDGKYQHMLKVFKDILGFREPTYHRIFGEKRGEEIIGLVKAIAPDWFAFEQKNKNFFQRLFDDYNTKNLILQSDIPTLVF